MHLMVEVYALHCSAYKQVSGQAMTTTKQNDKDEKINHRRTDINDNNNIDYGTI